MLEADSLNAARFGQDRDGYINRPPEIIRNGKNFQENSIKKNISYIAIEITSSIFVQISKSSRINSKGTIISKNEEKSNINIDINEQGPSLKCIKHNER